MENENQGYVKVSGEITIKTLNGRYGPFNTARLNVDIGEFIVKDKVLEQYQEGKYIGDFWIKLIKPSMYTSNGRIVVENRAYLFDLSIQDFELLSQSTGNRFNHQEPDPIDEEINSGQALINTNAGKKDNQLSVNSDSDSNHDEELFGVLWPLEATIKLDATVSRELLRKQKDRLGQLGYHFQFSTQSWHRLDKGQEDDSF